jgi:hypothetical protein
MDHLSELIRVLDILLHESDGRRAFLAADATRLTELARMSPAAKTQGGLLSSRYGSRPSAGHALVIRESCEKAGPVTTKP